MLKLKHNKQKQELINEEDENIRISIEDIQDEYKRRIKEFTSDHENLYKTLKEQLICLKANLDEYNDISKFINKNHHYDEIKYLKIVS